MNLSDDSLLAGMAMGDAAAAAAFVRRYQPRVYGLALTIVRSNTVAEEVAHAKNANPGVPTSRTRSTSGARCTRFLQNRSG
jgi:hypothetical protein